MDGLEELQSVVVIGATNRPTLLDPALLRPGRFDELVYIPVPDRLRRGKILGIQSAKMPLSDDVDLEEIASRTDRYTGADLEDLVRRAGLEALRRDLREPGDTHVEKADFEKALAESRPSVTEEMEAEYERMQKHLKQDAAAAQSIGFIAPRMRED
mgnify:FL=1